MEPGCERAALETGSTLAIDEVRFNETNLVLLALPVNVCLGYSIDPRLRNDVVLVFDFSPKALEGSRAAMPRP